MNEIESTLNQDDDPPFRLMNLQPRKPPKTGGKAKRSLSRSDLDILAKYIHREDFTREELAKRFGLTIRQLRQIITDNGWDKREGEDDDETNLPTGPDPVPCPFPPGSEGKLWILEERYARRLELWHPEDRVKPESEAERIAKHPPKKRRRPEPEPTPEELEAIERELREQWPEDHPQSPCPLPSSEISESRPPINSPD